MFHFHRCIRKFSSTTMRKSTIFALSSGRGKCGVAVIRVSGPHASTALKEIAGLDTLCTPRYALLRNLCNPETKEVLDKGLILWFPGPCSFTGEDSCEFQVHGGIAVVSSILKALGSIKNFRLASPGEFTKRAFYNGKLDLTEAEGLADLLSAETEMQRKQALLQTKGHLSNIYKSWKYLLIKSLANLEAFIDFHETENIDNEVKDETVQIIIKLCDNIRKHLRHGTRGERLRNGVRTVLVGKTNVGKSSLINLLANRTVAIVTPVHGTTRDVLEVTLDINGYPLVLLDTAGIRPATTDSIEKEGISRTLDTCRESDLVILIIDSEQYLAWYKSNLGKPFFDFIIPHIENLNISNYLIVKGANDSVVFKKQCIIIANKIDLIKDEDLYIFGSFHSIISCKSQKGLEHLINEITNQLKILCSEPSKEDPTMTQMRHREHLTKCLDYLEAFVNEKDSIDFKADLMAEQLRKALHQLNKLTGAFTTEQLLDIVFKNFCIGK
ncbi:hypothetical protein FQA39_LY00238 [Lamprigera yunnana]|nr:hypothetical protein FQA39_LY00238 [Lamprigera yunnana]